MSLSMAEKVTPAEALYCSPLAQPMDLSGGQHRNTSCIALSGAQSGPLQLRTQGHWI